MSKSFPSSLLYEFETSILDFKNKKYLVAVSGGLDSMVLVNTMFHLGLNFEIVHINYNLRGQDSIEDCAFIKKWAKKNQITTHILEDHSLLDIADKKSIQNQARILRYKYFSTISEENNIDNILTAHHKNDRIETSILNLIKGTGLRGISSIKALNGIIFRPLLNFSRSDIYNYANQTKIEWREDISNQSTKYQRNYVRHEVIPVLKTINSNLEESMGRTIDNLTDSYDFINAFILNYRINNQTDFKNYIKIDLSPIIKYKGLNAFLHQLLQEYDLNSNNINTLNKLITSTHSGSVIAGNYNFEVKKKFLFVYKTALLNNKVSILIEELPFEKWLDKNNFIKILKDHDCLIVDYNSTENYRFKLQLNDVHFPLEIRQRKSNDRIELKGMPGKHQDLKKTFSHLGLSKIERAFTYLLQDKKSIISILANRNSIRVND